MSRYTIQTLGLYQIISAKILTSYFMFFNNINYLKLIIINYYFDSGLPCSHFFKFNDNRL